MQAIAEYVPWIVFGLVYNFAGGIYPATASLMGAMALLLAFDWLTTRKIPRMHLVLAVLVWVFGAATLYFHDVRFLQWKASLFYWIAGLVFGGSAFIGKQTALEKLLGSVSPEAATIPASSWRNCSLVMGAFYLLLGAVNIWIALNLSEHAWVTFKIWIALPLGAVFTVGIVLWLFRGMLFEKEPTP